MEYQICYENWKNTFSVPSCVTDEYLSGCGAVQLKVLLLLLRHSASPLSIADLSDILSIPQADIRGGDIKKGSRVRYRFSCRG